MSDQVSVDPAGPEDKSRWSTRYYRTDCEDVLVLMKTSGPDEREDPPVGTALACIVEGHDQHALTRISPDDFERLNEEAEEDDDE